MTRRADLEDRLDVSVAMVDKTAIWQVPGTLTDRNGTQAAVAMARPLSQERLVRWAAWPLELQRDRLLTIQRVLCVALVCCSAGANVHLLVEEELRPQTFAGRGPLFFVRVVQAYCLGTLLVLDARTFETRRTTRRDLSIRTLVCSAAERAGLWSSLDCPPARLN